MIYYLVPDYDQPSWGTGLLYHHVRLLREHGYDACVLHRQAPFRLSWIDVDAPVRYLTSGVLSSRVRPQPADIVVVPEVLAGSSDADLGCRRIVFVQGSFLMLNGFSTAIDYRSLGYEAAIAPMPHIRDIVARHFGLSPVVVPPFVAPYFFCGAEALTAPREKRIVLASKAAYLQAGYFDLDIARKILLRHVSRRSDWEIVTLSGFTHRQAAKLMRQSEILVNLATLESFNATVPEAMAAGCLVWCYEAYGGRDILRPGVNARVWQNNYIYPLLDDLCSFLDDFDEKRNESVSLRRAAFETACGFQEARTAEALVSFFRGLLE